MINRLLWFVGIALIIISCADKSTTPNEEVAFENKKFIRATIDGVAFSAFATSGLCKVAEDGDIDFEVDGTNTGFFSLNLNAEVPSAGTYAVTAYGSTAIATMSYSSFQPPIPYYGSTDEAPGTLIVDRIDRGLMRIKGRFSGTLKKSDGATVTVTDGTFETSWE